MLPAHPVPAPPLALEDEAGVFWGFYGDCGRVIYGFGNFRLDTDRFELAADGERVHLEPRVFDLLHLFAGNPGIVIDRDRMIAEVWGGRIVSEATLSTAIKAVRQAIGDSGAEQAMLETVRGRGFRFRGPVSTEGPRIPALPAAPEGGDTETLPLAAGRPSIAVLPLVRLGDPELLAGLEDALPHEVILALARLHWLFVIARGSAFQFRGPDVDPAAVGMRLGVRYCLTGTLEVFGRTVAVTVELCDSGTGGVVWGERFTGSLDDVHALRARMVAGVAGALEVQIPLNEALKAQGRLAENLDAWQAFHLGVKRVHEYTPTGNAAAEALFARAVQLEPGFARAHAGLSFAHFQNAFLRYRPDHEAEVAAAVRCAARGLELDPLDPFTNFNMGRTYWLKQELEAALPWLERATEISPNYAQGHYSHAIMQTMLGDGRQGRPHVERAMALSPIDPLLYAMRATKALGHVTDGALEEAARWADAAARTPRAHPLIAMIAMTTAALSGDRVTADRWAAEVRRRQPGATRTYFFEALPVRHPETRRRLEQGLSDCGF